MADTRFKKGRIPWNKDTIGVMKPNSGSFVKGQPAYNRVGTVKTCVICPKEYPVKGAFRRINSKYCSMVCRAKGTKNRLGKTASFETREKQSGPRPHTAGKNHYNWKGGSTHGERVRFRDQMQQSILQRDNYTCQICDIQGSPLQVDHIKRWAEYPELRFEATNCRTVCMACHYYVTFKKRLPQGVIWGHNFSKRIAL